MPYSKLDCSTTTAFTAEKKYLLHISVPPARIMTHIFFIKCCSSFSASFNCAEFTVSEKDCSETCSNVGGTVEATEWCSSYSTVSANRKWKRTKTVQCKAYCSGKLAELDDLVTKYCLATFSFCESIETAVLTSIPPG